MLVAAAYNAGPSRPKRWIVDYGDPRAPQVDAVDWIEHIPFDETRNYVMRVTEIAAGLPRPAAWPDRADHPVGRSGAPTRGERFRRARAGDPASTARGAPPPGPPANI